MQLGWQASHKKRFSNSRSSAGGGTTSDSESSVVFVPTTKAEAADRRSAPVVRPATDEDQHQRAVHVNWAARKFTGPFGQPTAVTMPKGMRTALPRDPAAASQKYAYVLGLWKAWVCCSRGFQLFAFIPILTAQRRSGCHAKHAEHGSGIGRDQFQGKIVASTGNKPPNNKHAASLLIIFRQP